MADDAHKADKAAKAKEVNKANWVNKTDEANKASANEVGESIASLLLLPFSLTKYTAIFAKVKGCIFFFTISGCINQLILNLVIVANEDVGVADIANDLDKLVVAKGRDELDKLFVAKGRDELNELVMTKGCDEPNELVVAKCCDKLDKLVVAKGQAKGHVVTKG